MTRFPQAQQPTLISRVDKYDKPKQLAGSLKRCARLSNLIYNCPQSIIYTFVTRGSDPSPITDAQWVDVFKNPVIDNDNLFKLLC